MFEPLRAAGNFLHTDDGLMRKRLDRFLCSLCGCVYICVLYMHVSVRACVFVCVSVACAYAYNLNALAHNT